MQNPKLKLSMVGAAIVAFATVAIAQQPAAPAAGGSASASATVSIPAAAVQAPVVPAHADTALQFGSSGSSSNLDEITRLKFEKAKLELKKDIAKLRADIEEAETGKKPGAASSPAAVATALNQVPVGPTPQQVLHNSITLLSVYGSDDKLTAEIGSIRGKTIGRVGTVLPSGETVTVIKPDYVIVSQGKQSRRLNPSTEDAITYASQQLTAAPAATPANQTPGGMPMIQPFNPSDFLTTPSAKIPPGAPMGGVSNGKDEKKPAGL
jgi:type IV pilus biogenesis protein PilP